MVYKLKRKTIVKITIENVIHKYKIIQVKIQLENKSIKVNIIRYLIYVIYFILVNNSFFFFHSLYTNK